LMAVALDPVQTRPIRRPAVPKIHATPPPE
jgi:hypothetical protein